MAYFGHRREHAEYGRRGGESVSAGAKGRRHMAALGRRSWYRFWRKSGDVPRHGPMKARGTKSNKYH